MQSRFVLLALVVFVTLTLNSCVSSNWVKPGATQADFDADKLACRYEAAKATGSSSSVRMADVMAEGWRQGEIEMLCMQTRGYTRERVN